MGFLSGLLTVGGAAVGSTFGMPGVGAMVGSMVGGALEGPDANQQAATEANNQAANATRLQSQIAGEQWSRYKEMYSPLEASFVRDAQSADSPAAYDKAAGLASASVETEFAKARDRLGRTPGLDPSSGAYQAGMSKLGLAEAATSATQQNTARKNVQDMAYAKKTDALSLGKGLPANASAGLASATRSNLGLAEVAGGYAATNSKNLAGLASTVGPEIGGWIKNYNATNATPADTSMIEYT